jgi:hypothetical protein
MIPEFRNAVLLWAYSANTHGTVVPYQLQRIFVRLEMSMDPVPKNDLITSFGWKKAPMPADAFEFVEGLLKLLEEKLKNVTKNRPNIREIFEFV